MTNEESGQIHEAGGTSKQHGAIPKQTRPKSNEKLRKTQRHEEIDRLRRLSEGSPMADLRGFDIQERSAAETEKINLLDIFHRQEEKLRQRREQNKVNNRFGKKSVYELSDSDDQYEETIRKNCQKPSFVQHRMNDKNCRKSLDFLINQSHDDKTNTYNMNSYEDKDTVYNLQHNKYNYSIPRQTQKRDTSERSPSCNTVVYRLPIDIQSMPTFNSTSNMNPVEFLKRLETWMEDQQIQPNEYISWTKRSLRGSAKLWNELFCDDIASYTEWKTEFLQKYWNRSKQQKVLLEIYTGQYNISSENSDMASYFLRMLKKIKEIDLITVNEGIELIINHFPINTARTLTSLNPKSQRNILDTLESLDNLENRQIKQRFFQISNNSRSGYRNNREHNNRENNVIPPKYRNENKQEDAERHYKPTRRYNDNNQNYNTHNNYNGRQEVQKPYTERKYNGSPRGRENTSPSQHKYVDRKNQEQRYAPQRIQENNRTQRQEYRSKPHYSINAINIDNSDSKHIASEDTENLYNYKHLVYTEPKTQDGNDSEN